jgi:hypothetical protein
MRRSTTVLASVGASLVLGIIAAPAASAKAPLGGPDNCTGYSASNFPGGVNEEGTIPSYATLPHEGAPSVVGVVARSNCTVIP